MINKRKKINTQKKKYAQKNTCIARRLPVGSVKNPDKKHPNGTNSKFIEPWNERVMNIFYKYMDDNLCNKLAAITLIICDAFHLFE